MRSLQNRAARLIPAMFGALALATAAGAAGVDTNAKPSISLKATPQIGFSPLRVVLTAELKGGANDYEEFYCPTIEWFWDDDTKSESKGDCEPYEAGKSEIKRRYTIDRIFNTMGEYRVEFRLKQKGKTVGLGKTQVRVRPGIRDGGQ
jgi:hypothetical protein